MAEQIIAVTEGSGKNVSTWECTINSQTVQIERSLIGMGQITLPGTAQVNQIGVIGLVSMTAIDVQGRFYIICKNTFNDNASVARYRIAFYDTAGTLIGFGAEASISNLGILDDDATRYVGDNCIYSNDFGATSFGIYITEITSGGNISIYIGVV